jgi:small subunit ribosomal protein S27Ae
MAVLKYYKVDSSGKIKRLRRECPVSVGGRCVCPYDRSLTNASFALQAPECGAGIFMAWHSNRQYCGKVRAVIFPLMSTHVLNHVPPVRSHLPL